MTRRTFDPDAMFSVLVGHQVRFVAIGGWAAGAQGAGWPTFDLDIVIDAEEDNLVRATAALEHLRAEYDTFHQPPIRADLRRVTQSKGPQLFRTAHGRLDVLKEAGGETYASLLEDAVELEQAGHRVLCASVHAILRMKRAANRPKDRAGIAKLEEALRSRQETED